MKKLSIIFTAAAVLTAVLLLSSCKKDGTASFSTTVPKPEGTEENRFSETASEIREEISDKLETASEIASDMGEGLSEALSEAGERVSEKIEENEEKMSQDIYG